jgi:CheY-like chemotaxis protein
LKIWGMTPVSVPSGREALGKLAEHHFDVVLIDMQMPEMDGITLAHKIHQTSQVPLILLSSVGEAVVGEEASLFRSQIPKPIKQSLLLDALRQAAGADDKKMQKAPDKRYDQEMASRHPLRILLAEDNSVNQKVGQLMLARLGYHADLAGNGLEALQAVDKAPYDLILMDIQMPEMDGARATRTLRKKLGDKCPFIVALTAEALDGDRERFLSMGFDGYLSKPLGSDELQNMLRTVKLKN